jgi:hypothetical protein
MINDKYGGMDAVGDFLALGVIKTPLWLVDGFAVGAGKSNYLKIAQNNSK